MKSLVTGSEGFIGRNLINSLKKNNKDVVEYDTKSYNVLDIISQIDFNDIEKIYHLGAISSTTEQDTNRVYLHNTWFSIELFKKAIEHKIPIVYASSGSVYGNTIKDGLYLHNPLNYYAATKLMSDIWVKDHIDDFSHVVGLRFFNVYGADEQKDDLSTSPIYRFGLQAKTEGVIKIFKGSQHTYRDFICVEDILKAMNYAMTGMISGIYDVGTCNPISFMDVAEMCSEKYNVPIKFIPMPDIIKGKYQTYTKARPHMPFDFCSVEDWLKSFEG
jgi:ADP-L-glycero-D-manno-heptose 6-epimerase